MNIDHYEEFELFEATIAGQTIPVITHYEPHIDEVKAIDLVVQLADEEFVKKHCPDGKLRLGVGGGDFDDHVENRKEKGDCCLTLVAKALGVIDKPEFKKVIKNVQLNDNKGRQNPRYLGPVLKNLHRQFSDLDSQVDNVNWAMQGLMVKGFDSENGDFTINRIYGAAKELIAEKKIDTDAIEPEAWLQRGEGGIQDHQLKFEQAQAEWREKFNSGDFLQKIAKHQNGSGQITYKKIIALYSDQARMSVAIRNHLGPEVAIIIQKKSTGHVIVSANQKFIKNLEEEIAIIRYEEQLRKGEITISDWQTLRSQGMVPGIEEWYHDTDLTMLYNSSLTHPNVPPTKLSLEKILELVHIGYDKSLFHMFCYKDCKKGVCRGRKCSWYPWGLYRCRDIRRTNYQKV
jgi:hypothetical protein